MGLIPEFGRSPEWVALPTPVFLPGESCGQRSLVGSSPWSDEELDMTEPACIILHYKAVIANWFQCLPPVGNGVRFAIVHK